MSTVLPAGKRRSRTMVRSAMYGTFGLRLDPNIGCQARVASSARQNTSDGCGRPLSARAVLWKPDGVYSSGGADGSTSHYHRNNNHPREEWSVSLASPLGNNAARHGAEGGFYGVSIIEDRHHRDLNCNPEGVGGGGLIGEMTNCFRGKFKLDESASSSAVCDRSSLVTGPDHRGAYARSLTTANESRRVGTPTEQRRQQLATTSSDGASAEACAAAGRRGSDRAAVAEFRPRAKKGSINTNCEAWLAACTRSSRGDEEECMAAATNGAVGSGEAVGLEQREGYFRYQQHYYDNQRSGHRYNDRLSNTYVQQSNPPPPPSASTVCGGGVYQPSNYWSLPWSSGGMEGGKNGSGFVFSSRPSRGTSTSFSSSSTSSPSSSSSSFNSVLAQAEFESYPSRRNPSPLKGGWKGGNVNKNTNSDTYQLPSNAYTGNLYSKPAFDLRRYGGFSSSPYHASDLDGGRIAHAGLVDEYYDSETSFMSACNLCSKRLGPNEDIYIYRGDSAFCSPECRQQVIQADQGFSDACQSSSGNGEAPRRKMPLV